MSPRISSAVSSICLDAGDRLRAKGSTLIPGSMHKVECRLPDLDAYALVILTPDAEYAKRLADAITAAGIDPSPPAGETESGDRAAGAEPIAAGGSLERGNLTSLPTEKENVLLASLGRIELSLDAMLKRLG